MNLFDRWLGRSNPLDSDEVELKSDPSEMEEGDAVKLVNSRAEEALKHRADMEGQWAVSLAFENSQQWVEWDKAAKTLKTLINPDSAKSRIRWRTYNLIRPMVKKLVANATRNKPASIFRPQNPESQADEMATAEARDLVTHYGIKFCDQETLRRIAHFNYTATTVYYKQTWDPNEKAFVPSQFDPATGEPSAFEEAPVGDICERVVPGPEILVDPRDVTPNLKDSRWIIHAHVLPTAEIKERWGVAVPADGKGAMNAERVGPFLAMMAKNASSGATLGYGREIPENTALVYEMYEKRSKERPDGLMVICTSQKLIFQGSLPYKCVEFPFIAIGLDPSPDSPYCRGVVEDLVAPQMDLNRLFSRILERMEYDKLTVTAVKGVGMGVDAFEENRHMRRVYVDQAAGIGGYNVSQPPPINPEWITMISVIKEQFQDIAGVHDVSQGMTGGGVTAGSAIRLLQDADASQHSQYYQTVEEFCAERDRRRIGLAAEFFAEPRQINTDLTTEGSEGQPTVKSQTFEGLLNGGKTRVSVVPGSATPKSPEIHNQEIKEMYQLGMFGPPGDPVANEMALRLLKLNDSDKIADLMHQMVADQKQQMEEQAALAQLQAVGGASQAMMQGEAQMMQANQPPPAKAKK